MLKFLIFADLHYKKKMYASTVEHLEAILDRAAKEDVDFVIHAGDFCNDYIGSPEIINAYLNNRHYLAVYGVYGNHELESQSNSMQAVTPLLCNREVVFGDGAGYWYTDIKGYRLIGLDTNYSYSPENGEWRHNTAASWGPPKGNVKADSLAPEQLRWLDEVLADAVDRQLKACVFSHASFSGIWQSSPDSETVRGIFRKYNNVLLAVNGHLHTDHFAVRDNVAYFDVNTVLNGFWKVSPEHHYTDEHTYDFQNYDSNGNKADSTVLSLNTLSQGKNTWFFESPLSAVVTLSDDGRITVKGSKTSWKYGVEPPGGVDGVKACIEDREVVLKP